MAHAEMDALSQVPFGTRITGSLYTTFEPCIMCAATIAFYRVPEVHFAAADPFFDGLHDWMGSYPFTAERLPDRIRLGGPIGAFCHVLHLAWLVAYPAPPNVIDAHRRFTPSTLECANTIADLIASGRSAIEAQPSSKRYRSSGRTSWRSVCDIYPAHGSTPVLLVARYSRPWIPVASDRPRRLAESVHPCHR
jgi:hypothetical protein